MTTSTDDANWHIFSSCLQWQLGQVTANFCPLPPNFLPTHIHFLGEIWWLLSVHTKGEVVTLAVRKSLVSEENIGWDCNTHEFLLRAYTVYPLKLMGSLSQLSLFETNFKNLVNGNAVLSLLSCLESVINYCFAQPINFILWNLLVRLLFITFWCSSNSPFINILSVARLCL